MAEASCPASCGELIQGWINGGEKLVSCPVDWFSTVEISNGNAHSSRQRPMMRQALNLTLKQLGIAQQESQQLKIDYCSTIPVAKGMASSTADIAATIVAAFRHFKQSYSEQLIASLCARLEPTDSTMFSGFTLFDHNQGLTAAEYGSMSNMDILILESPLTIKTESYHRVDHSRALLASANQLHRANRKLANAIKFDDAYQLGLSSTTSAIESQKILPKPHFCSLLNLVEKHDLFGLNVAHSGSVIGLLFNAKQHDIEKVMFDMRQLGINTSYPQWHHHNVIAGGVR